MSVAGDFPNGSIIAVSELVSHNLVWSRDNPAFAEVGNGNITFITAPPVDWGRWVKQLMFPNPTMRARLATEDEIAVMWAMRALLADPLPDL